MPSRFTFCEVKKVAIVVKNCDCLSLGKKISVLGQSHRLHFAQNRCFCCLATNIRLAEKIGENYSIVRNAKNVNKNRKKTHPQSFLQKLPKTSRAPGKLHQNLESILFFTRARTGSSESSAVTLLFELDKGCKHSTFPCSGDGKYNKDDPRKPHNGGRRIVWFSSDNRQVCSRKESEYSQFRKKTIQKFKYSQF